MQDTLFVLINLKYIYFYKFIKIYLKLNLRLNFKLKFLLDLFLFVLFKNKLFRQGAQFSLINFKYIYFYKSIKIDLKSNFQLDFKLKNLLNLFIFVLFKNKLFKQNTQFSLIEKKISIFQL